jgi:hypothetical protein
VNFDAVPVRAGGVLPFAGDEFEFDKNLGAFVEHCSASWASPSLKMTMRCHSVRPTRLSRLSFQLSPVARTSVTMRLPSRVVRASGVAAAVADQLHAVEIPGHC